METAIAPALREDQPHPLTYPALVGLVAANEQFSGFDRPVPSFYGHSYAWKDRTSLVHVFRT